MQYIRRYSNKKPGYGTAKCDDPPKIAEYAKSLGEYGVDVKVLGEKEMKKLGMDLYWA